LGIVSMLCCWLAWGCGSIVLDVCSWFHKRVGHPCSPMRACAMKVSRFVQPSVDCRVQARRRRARSRRRASAPWPTENGECFGVWYRSRSLRWVCCQMLSTTCSLCLLRFPWSLSTQTSFRLRRTVHCCGLQTCTDPAAVFVCDWPCRLLQERERALTQREQAAKQVRSAICWLAHRCRGFVIIFCTSF
jgi:hypothetical protein